jgi:ABC-type phosphate/phosphonate transport system substrate-binding protein
VCAYTRRHSHSGYNALRAAVAPLAGGGSFFSRVVESGSHAASIELVATGEADVCAVDCVTHALIAKYRPDALGRSRVLGATEHTPGAAGYEEIN